MTNDFLGGWDGPKGVDHPSRKFVRGIVEDGESLLDVGCGTAIELRGFLEAKRKIRYTGIDSDYGRGKWCADEYPDGNFVVGDFKGWSRDVGEGAYDNVLVRAVLEHNLDHAEIVRLGLRLAKKRLILVIFNWWEGDEDLKFRVKEDGTICGTLSLPKLRKLIEGYGGYVVEEAGPFEHNHYVLVVGKKGGRVTGVAQTKGGQIGKK